MPIICKTSVERVKQSYKQQTGQPIKQLMGCVGDAYETPAHTNPLNGDTLQRYIRDRHTFTDPQIEAIKAAFRTLGYEVDVEGEQTDDYVFDDTFVAVTPHMTPPEGRNRVEPDTPGETATLSASYTIGARTVSFGKSNGGATVYTGQLSARALTFDLNFSEEVTLDTVPFETLLPLTHTSAARKFSFTLTGIKRGLGSAQFGTLKGCFSKGDHMTLYVAPLSLKVSEIEDILGDPVPAESHDEALSAEIDKERARVLEGAARRANGGGFRILRKRLLPDD